MHGPPTIVCSVYGGQCTKSHCRSGRSCPSTISVAVPERTRKSSWSLSQWDIDNGWPGPSTVMPNPSCSKTVSPPKFENLPQPSDSYQRSSCALTTNQPSPLHTRPCSVSSTGASGTSTPSTIRVAQSVFFALL